jgi:UDP-2,4-diacetamido-2,4,6-trideoxy-beta-L-altropyranose hydrolase
MNQSLGIAYEMQAGMMIKNRHVVVENLSPFVLFKVQGGNDFGTGHVMRSLELANEFSPSRVTFFCNDDESIVRQIKNRGFTYVVSSMDEETEIALLSRVLRDKKVDIIVVDQPTAYGALCRRLRKVFGDLFIVGLDCFENERSFDLIINLWERNNNSIALKKPQYFEGLQYAIIRDSFQQYATITKKIRDHPETIVLTFGGVDPNLNTVKVLKLLNKITDQRLKIQVVLGFAFKDEKTVIDECNDGSHMCTLMKKAPNFEELVFKADLGFTGAGTTMMEFCAVGTPLIVCPQNEQERLFAKIFEQKGAVQLLDTNNEEAALKIIRETISDLRFRKALSKKQKQLIDIKGKKRIKHLIFKNFRLSKEPTK